MSLAVQVFLTPFILLRVKLKPEERDSDYGVVERKPLSLERDKVNVLFFRELQLELL
jgi:hypothetical protein